MKVKKKLNNGGRKDEKKEKIGMKEDKNKEEQNERKK